MKKEKEAFGNRMQTVVDGMVYRTEPLVHQQDDVYDGRSVDPQGED